MPSAARAVVTRLRARLGSDLTSSSIVVDSDWIKLFDCRGDSCSRFDSSAQNGGPKLAAGSVARFTSRIAAAPSTIAWCSFV